MKQQKGLVADIGGMGSGGDTVTTSLKVETVYSYLVGADKKNGHRVGVMYSLSLMEKSDATDRGRHGGVFSLGWYDNVGHFGVDDASTQIRLGWIWDSYPWMATSGTGRKQFLELSAGLDASLHHPLLSGADRGGGGSDCFTTVSQSGRTVTSCAQNPGDVEKTDSLWLIGPYFDCNVVFMIVNEFRLTMGVSVQLSLMGIRPGEGVVGPGSFGDRVLSVGVKFFGIDARF